MLGRMKNIILAVIVCLFIVSCSNKNDIDNIVFKEWNKCLEKDNCKVDFAQLMTFDWDTMYYYSAAYSLEDINKEIGFELQKFIDVGDRVIFLNKGSFAYQQEWFYNPEEQFKGVFFDTNMSKFKISKKDAIFSVKKINDAFYLPKFNK